MADRIVVLKDGVVQQVDAPQEMYDQPTTVFVAGFIGSPAMNFINARLEREDGGFAATFGRTRLPLSREAVGEKSDELGQYVGKDVALGIRPEHIEDAGLAEGEALGGGNAPNTMEVEPQVIESMGSEKYVYFEVPRELTVHLHSLEEITEGVGAGADEGGAEPEGSADDFGDLMVARVSAESTARLRENMRLVIDASKIKLFDPESEKALI
jgi:multiple sugar transport system ATP-binding protein